MRGRVAQLRLHEGWIWDQPRNPALNRLHLYKHSTVMRASRRLMIKRPLKVAVLCVVTGTAFVAPVYAADFQVEEATIAGIQAAIKSGSHLQRSRAGLPRAREGVQRRLHRADHRRRREHQAGEGLRPCRQAAGVSDQDRRSIDGVSRSGSVPRSAARLRTHGTHRLRSERVCSRWACASAFPTSVRSTRSKR